MSGLAPAPTSPPTDPDGIVTYRDLAADPVPHLDDVAFFAQFVPEPDRTPEQAAALALGTQLIDEVLAADTILIGLPLYNFGPEGCKLAIWRPGRAKFGHDI
jgi:FMN-dependent NADH-azoreductase